MGYIKQATITNQIETNTYLDMIHRDAENTYRILDAITDEIINYMNTGKLNERDIYSNLAILRMTTDGICELAKKAKLDIEIHE